MGLSSELRSAACQPFFFISTFESHDPDFGDLIEKICSLKKFKKFLFETQNEIGFVGSKHTVRLLLNLSQMKSILRSKRAPVSY